MSAETASMSRCDLPVLVQGGDDCADLSSYAACDAPAGLERAPEVERLRGDEHLDREAACG